MAKLYSGKLWILSWIVGFLVVALIIGVIVYYSFFKKEKYGYIQNLDRNYTDLTYQNRERHSVESPGQFETANDMPEATSSYTNPNLSFL